MTSSLSPTVVLSGMIDACRNWRSWLMGLDNIPEQEGITGLVTSNCHWLSFCRRQDLPMEIAAVYGNLAEPGMASAPGDVMRLVKTHMSDADLSQKPFCFLRGGSSNLMANPRGPAFWEARVEFNDDDKRNMRRLCEKIRRIMPSRAAAACLRRRAHGKAAYTNPATTRVEHYCALG